MSWYRAGRERDDGRPDSKELAARIRSVLRRTRRGKASGPVLSFGDIELDQDAAA